jgi:hypothetical protein
LYHGLQAASSRALQYAKKKKKSEARRDSAKQGTHGEDREASHEKAFAAEDGYQPAADRQHDRVGDEVGSEDPSALVVARAEIPCDVGQRHVGDGGVQHFHEGCKRHHDGDEPRIGFWFPVFVRESYCGSAHLTFRYARWERMILPRAQKIAHGRIG